MKNLLNRVFNYGFIRSRNIRIRQGSIDRRLEKRYVEEEHLDDRGEWKLLLDTDEVFKQLDYKDETWKYVKRLDKYFVLHSFGLFEGIRVPYTPIDKHHQQVIRTQQGIYQIKSKGIAREWLYMTTYGQQYRNVKIEIDIVFKTLFKEFQIAFCHKSLFERLRFRIVDGDKLVFEVVTKGFFSKPISQKHYQLETNKKYHFDVTCINGKYTFSEGDKQLMTVRDCEYEKETGNVGVIFWDDKAVSNIDAEIYTCKIYTL